jgi:hypothetical protein
MKKLLKMPSSILGYRNLEVYLKRRSKAQVLKARVADFVILK